MDTDKRQRGRPEQPEDDRIVRKLPVSFSRNQIDELRQRASKAGQTLTDYVRRALGLG